MKIYSFRRSQILPLALAECWKFFSSPKNLGLITPKQMGFEMLHCSGGDKMYPGQIIRYRIRIFPLVVVKWVTEITHVQEPLFFVDEQRSGPYAMWHHQHHFRQVINGIEMIDEVNYAIPYGIIGRLANSLFVERQVNAIFDYRARVLATYFTDETTRS